VAKATLKKYARAERSKNQNNELLVSADVDVRKPEDKEKLLEYVESIKKVESILQFEL